MRKAMKNTIFGTALVAMLLGAGTAANAQRPGFDGRGGFARGGFERGGYERGYERGFDRPVVREGYFHERVRPVGPEVGFGVTVGAPVYNGYVEDTYIPPCPGDGYEWNAGYYNAGVWVPGAWRLRAGYVARPYGYGYGRGYERPVFHGYGHGFYGRR